MTFQRSIYQPFFAYLKSLNFHYVDKWVIECLEYYKSNNPNISVEDLKDGLKQQWLLVNLRDLKVPALPPDLKTKEKTMLNGTYVVQVESMIDSSQSCYSQFQKLMKVNTENIEATAEYTERKAKANRCLTFVVCDGVQELEAMEYQPINKIKTNDPELLPGFKMTITGPVECRKGMILLKDENVKILGGEVDTLTESNSLKSILIERLQLDESDYVNTTSANSVDDNNEIPQPSSSVGANENYLGDECVESLLSQNDDLFLSLPLETEILPQNVNPQSSLNNTNNEPSNEILREQTETTEQLENYWGEELDIFSETSRNKKHNLSDEDISMSTQKRLSLDPDFQDDETESHWRNSTNKMTEDIEVVSELQWNSLANNSKIKKPVQTKLSSFFRNNYAGLNNVCSTSVHPEKPVFVSHKPFMYLRQIISRNWRQCHVFTVKGIILTLKKKITIENDEFSLRATVTDGSAAVDVDFSSEILEDLLGFSPCEMTAMMKNREQNTAIGQRIKESLSKTQEKLISLNCLMSIKFFKGDQSPLVVSLQEVTIHDLNALKERMLKEK